MSYTWFSSSGKLNLTFPTLEDAQYCAHQGDCLPEVQETVGLDWMAPQLAKIDPDVLRSELGEYGAWDSDELADHEDNLERIVWMAANDVAEEPDVYVSEGQWTNAPFNRRMGSRNYQKSQPGRPCVRVEMEG